MHSKDNILSKYKINKISEVDINKLSYFYKKIYFERHKSLTNNWRWWYRVGLTEGEPIILSLDDKIIGQAAYLPTELNVLGKKIPAIWFQDYAVLPDFKGKGLGKLLSKEWMKICPNQMAICSPDSLRVLKKLGWKDNFDTKRLAKPINFTKFVPVIKNLKLNFLDQGLRYFLKKKYNRNKSLKLYKIENNFKTINESFKFKKSKKKDVKFAEIVRDENWLNWRLMECPYKKDIFFFEYKNNFSIVHVYSAKNIKRLNILYSYHTDELHENEITTMIANWAINNNIDLMWAINRGKELDNIFPKIFNKSIRFASYSTDKKIFEILQNGLLDFQGIDSDKESSAFIEE